VALGVGAARLGTSTVDPHPVSPLLTPVASPLRTPTNRFFDALGDEPLHATAYTLMPAPLPDSVYAAMGARTPPASPRSLSSSRPVPLPPRPFGPLYDLLCARDSPPPLEASQPLAFSPNDYSLLNSHRDASDSAHGASDDPACPDFCWICYPDASVPCNMASLDREDALRYVARIAGHGCGAYADGLLHAFGARE
jgi:hypothetical protein